MRYVFLALFLLFVSPALAADEGVIGTILEVEGSAKVTHDGGESAQAALNAPVYLYDSIVTDANSRVFILFIDDTQMVLSENAHLVINEYVFDPASPAGNKGAYAVMSGAFQYVSGLIGKNDNPDVTVETPVGAIGIRGTKFWGGEIDGEYGVFVDDGEVALKTDAGEALVRRGEGTTAQSRAEKPAAASVWTWEKMQRARDRVFLARRAVVMDRMVDRQMEHPQLREKYRQFLKNRPARKSAVPVMPQREFRPERLQQIKENLQQIQDQNQQKQQGKQGEKGEGQKEKKKKMTSKERREEKIRKKKEAIEARKAARKKAREEAE